MDWVQSTLTAMEKARVKDEEATREGIGRRGQGQTTVFSVPSESRPGESRTVTTVVVPKSPVQFACSCRSDVGLMQPPAGWVSCWHMATAARKMIVEGSVDLDKDSGLTFTKEEAWSP